MATTSLLAVREYAPAYYQRGTALQRVLLEAPYMARCSADKTATKVRPRQYAISHPYMQVNRPGMVAWLIFDLDHANPFAWQDAGLPAPNLIVQNRESLHSHLYYAIEPVCTTERGRARPIAYMKAIYAAMATRLRADPLFHSGPVAKTPGHPWWRTTELHPRVFKLGDLAEHVPLPRPSRAKAPADLPHSRHCLLFEELRHHAYATVGHARSFSYEAFVNSLSAHAHTLNNYASRGFARDLPLSSIRSTVRSVARWTWNRFTGQGNGVQRGVMQLDPTLPLKERQKRAAERSTRLRESTTAKRITDAWHKLRAFGWPTTHVNLARLAELCRQTVARYRDLLAELANTPPPEPPVAPPPVRSAVHQVAAASAACAAPSSSAGVVGSERVAPRLSDASSPGRVGVDAVGGGFHPAFPRSVPPRGQPRSGCPSGNGPSAPEKGGSS